MANVDRPLRPTLAVVLAATLLGGSCDISSVGSGKLTEGTWGGDDAAAIVTGDMVHVHFGCTNGDFPGPVELDADGRFSVTGAYHLHVYPVAIGPRMPAELAGVVSGRDLTMTVAVNDTVEDRLVVLGPTTVRLGRQPEMQACPICEVPGQAASATPPDGAAELVTPRPTLPGA